jgi:DNA modification methylase
MPVALIADAIGDVTRRSDIIIDPFAGVATTVLAAERMGRTAFGLESEARLIDAAVQRWQALTGAHAVLAQTGETFAAVAEQRGGEDAGDLTDEDDATAETHD